MKKHFLQYMERAVCPHGHARGFFLLPADCQVREEESYFKTKRRHVPFAPVWIFIN